MGREPGAPGRGERNTRFHVEWVSHGVDFFNPCEWCVNRVNSKYFLLEASIHFVMSARNGCPLSGSFCRIAAKSANIGFAGTEKLKKVQAGIFACL
jgi:hypothetical protein